MIITLKSQVCFLVFFMIQLLVLHLYLQKDTFQLFSEGNLDLILECCPDYWNGSALGRLHESVEKRILEFCQNSILGDGFIVAYAYRPIPAKVIASVPLVTCTRPFYIELPPENEKSMEKIPTLTKLILKDTTDSPKSDPEYLIEKIPHHKAISSLSTRNRLISKRSTVSQIDGYKPEIHTEEGFLNEVVKNQTFLGLASFFFPIKPVSFRTF
jgi:hypothetical protein